MYVKLIIIYKKINDRDIRVTKVAKDTKVIKVFRVLNNPWDTKVLKDPKVPKSTPINTSHSQNLHLLT